LGEYLKPTKDIDDFVSRIVQADAGFFEEIKQLGDWEDNLSESDAWKVDEIEDWLRNRVVKVWFTAEYQWQNSIASCDFAVAISHLPLAICKFAVASCELALAICKLVIASCNLALATRELASASCDLALATRELASASCDLALATRELASASCDLALAGSNFAVAS
jgi:hypothetical protein